MENNGQPSITAKKKKKKNKKNKVEKRRSKTKDQALKAL